jgi:hypothetical protein
MQLIAVTGRHTEADRKKSAAAGIRWHLVKPADPDFLRRLLAVFGHRGGRPGT